MDLDFAFIAQSADFLESDGKLTAWGIGIDGVESSEIPFQTVSMALVARLLLMPEEREAGHSYGVLLVDPEGDEEVLCANETLYARHLKQDQPSGLNLVVSLSLFCSTAGLYRVRLVVDGSHVKELPLRVSHVAEVVPSGPAASRITNG